MNIVSRAVSAIASAFRAKAFPPQQLTNIDRQGWTSLWFGRPATDFQNDIPIEHDRVLANWAVYSCVTLIASDIGKLCLKLVEKVDGIWIDADSPSFSPVLRKPNRHQTRQKFIEQWIVSKLTNGNAYILKERDQRGVVVGLYVLDPLRVAVLVAPDGSVYYRLQDDDLAKIGEEVAIPASEIIHDRMVCLFHPLCGISPIFACGLAAMQGLRIQNNSEKFFANMSRPGGILTAPGQISDDTAKRLKDNWEKNYTGDSLGKVAVLGDGLKYEPMAVNAVDSRMVEQLNLSAKMICATFHVPAFKIGLDILPAGQKVGDMNQIYYTDCLQALMEAAEALLDEGLGLTKTLEGGKQLGTMFDLDDLLKMDGATMTNVLKEQVGSAITSPDEARKRLNMPAVPDGAGASPMAQQQNYSLAALAKRDAGPDPFGTAKPEPAPAAAPAPPAPAADEEARAAAESAKAAAESATAEARALEQRIATTELWTREADRLADERRKAEAIESARVATEQAATVQRLLDSIPAMLADVVAKSAPVTQTLEAVDSDGDAEALAAALITRMATMELIDA